MNSGVGRHALQGLCFLQDHQLETMGFPMSAASEQLDVGVEPPDTRHYLAVADEISKGRVVPFLGAGANLIDRPNGQAFASGEFPYLPSGRELAVHLAGVLKRSHYRPRNENDLLLVSLDIEVALGQLPLYDELRAVFNRDYPLNSLHRFFASLPAILRQRGSQCPHQLIVTTNYDDVLERAFLQADEPYDLVFYVAEGKNKGKFMHVPPEGEGHSVLIERPNEYSTERLDPARRTVILKIHGAVDRRDPTGDSFVITEEQYINYLVNTDTADFLPVALRSKLKRSSFLFLGYGLRDWNLRVWLYRIWGERNVATKSWAIQLNPDTMDEQFWLRHQVKVLNEQLSTYITRLSERLQPAGSKP